jgi:hypothetical protein
MSSSDQISDVGRRLVPAKAVNVALAGPDELPALFGVVTKSCEAGEEGVRILRWKSSPAFPTVSGRSPDCDATTGHPRLCASTTGSRKPSYRDGKTSANARSVLDEPGHPPVRVEVTVFVRVLEITRL